ncbi:hypothetical protein [Stenotrophomonas acidaminiphila]|uniref:hypothetical protein n=1 Tax=Stenotrophomonas acidaminiphila TaxID=128780 RepID=UPI0015FB7FDA|nr:hypothetical protein [Stenotrophomonas acidaminiphila]
MSFYRTLAGPFNPYSWPDKSIAKKWTTFANLVDAEQFDQCTDQEISTAPCIFQEYLPTVADIWAGVTGEKIFALSMRHKFAGKINFRTMEESELSYEMRSVPGDIEIELKRTMRELDVDVASTDFVIGSDGEWIFIEANPLLENRCPDIKTLYDNRLFALLRRRR